MKRVWMIVILFIVFYSGDIFAQSIKKIDSIYVICYQDDLSGKFYTVKDNKSKIDFFFNVKWQLHEGNHESFIFNFTFPIEKDGFWAFPIKKLAQLLGNKNLYTLQEFVGKLKANEFLRPILNGKVQIIMLYGEKSSTKFEMYPVKIGTDLSSEG